MKLKFQAGSTLTAPFKSTPILIGMMTCGLLLTSPAKAQQYGIGMQPGMQGCNGGYGQANGAVAESDAAQEIERQISDLNEERNQNRSTIRELNREKRQLANAINRTILPKWASAFMAHMDNNRYNCCIEGEVPVQVEDAPRPKRARAPRLPVPGQKAPRKKTPKPAPDEGEPMSMNEPQEVSDRMPASLPAAAPAGTGVDEDGLGPDLGEGAPPAAGRGGGGPSPTSCYPADSMYTMAKWKGLACAGPGKISPNVCSGPYFTNSNGGRGGDVSCDHAISRYADLARELDTAEQRNGEIGNEMFDLRGQLREQKNDDRLEAGCATCAAARAQRGGAGGSFGPTLRAMSPVLGASAGFRIGGVRIGAGITSGGPGPLAMPYAQGGYGYPMAQNGVYGAVPGGVNNGFGCSAGVGGGGYPQGPYGMGGPYGQGPYQQQGAFGYPQGYQPGWPGLGGGGAYQPGYGPWGVAGPWGNSPAGISGQISVGNNNGSGFGGMLSGLLGGITRGISGLLGGFGGGGGGGGFGFGRPGYGYGGSGGYPNFGLGTRGGAPGILPISSGGGSPFGGGSGFRPATGITPFGAGAGGFGGQQGSPFRTTGSYSPYGVSGVSGGSTYLPYLNQNTNYYNNAIGQQIQQQQLYSSYLGAQQTLGQFNNGVNSLYGGSNYTPYGGYGYGGQAPSVLPAMSSPYQYGY